ncbi:glycosyl transferase [Solirubrobacter sp. CPCC 204708]|uniref:Glycosyl transferase n=1 Tax=Solirubrobacter deserti TaxID=2282478 RepID=A0ABT4RPR9_9ACTN|nr:nucleotide disphospho-sugar-binding domain-containing protein [Solirubrobacter deserti]MBE2316656.1 glycosyl transferase [Solirubrobacter deserti]MDA0140554.1 glycosyl transferase [Solirubrobacter deserti]
MRVLLGAFGDPGHAFPILALGSELVARGHEVGVETWQRWREPAEALGMTFAAAPEYQVFPTREVPLKPYEAAARAALVSRELVASFEPDVVVADILTAAPALAADLEGVPRATLVPHVFPDLPSGFPPFSIGARLPRTAVGRRLWGLTDRLVAIGVEQGRVEYNECRARLGLEPVPYGHSGLSRSLTMVGTFPQLEYPRQWPAWTRIVGPMLWELGGPLVEPPAGVGPVVLVATSTSQDPSGSLLRAALDGLADEPVRVIAISEPRDDAPANAVLAPWMSYAATMPHCDLVITHGGHGTVARALASGVPVLISPAAGDMAETAARVDWAGVGVRLAPRFSTPWGVRLAVRRALRSRGLRLRAGELARWVRANPGPAAAATQLERWAATVRRASSRAEGPAA